MTTFHESTIDVHAHHFMAANESAKREFINSAVWANIQWLIFLLDNDFQDCSLNDHDYFGNMDIKKDNHNYVISFSQWNYSDRKYFDTQLTLKIGDHFGMLRSLLYRLAPNENASGNLFHSYISYFENFLGEKIEGMTIQRAITFLDICFRNRPMFAIKMNHSSTTYNFHVVRR
ncbi:hypothetical protein A1Z55_RS10165 [Acinetobacter baumannii]|nr:hypothetical protein [Acinetobacter baumannii]